MESSTNGAPTNRSQAFGGLARLMTMSGIALVVVGVVLFFVVGPFLGAIVFIGMFDLGFALYMRRLAAKAKRDEDMALAGGVPAENP